MILLKDRGGRDASTTPMKVNKRLLTRLKKNTRVDNTYENKQEVVDTSQKTNASTTPMKINKRLLTRLKNKRVDNTNESKQEVVDTSQKKHTRRQHQ